MFPASSRLWLWWTRTSVFAPASSAIRAAAVLPHIASASGVPSMSSWTKTQTQIMRSTPRARSTTLAQGRVSPVTTTLPCGESTRWASESSHGWTCSALAVVTRQPWLDSVAYRLDTPAGSVVITGDTAPCRDVLELAAGADTLVMQCLDLQERLAPATRASMAGTLDVGRLAAEAGVGRVVLVHQRAALDAPDATERALAEVRSAFGGPVHFSHELERLALD